MKKNVSRMLSVILAICMVVSLVPFVWATESADTVEILMLDTSDIHGQLYATDYTADYRDRFLKEACKDFLGHLYTEPFCNVFYNRVH